jgi:hypothetical protein
MIDLYCRCSHWGKRHCSLGCLDCKDKAEKRIITVNEMCWNFNLDPLSIIEYLYDKRTNR